MKTIEEKTKAYDEALERARKLKEDPTSVFYDYSPSEGDTVADYIFPELKESEDDRIRGAIIDHLKDNNLIEWAAWFEKQGEEKKITHEEVSNANKDEVIRCLINGMKFYYEDNAEATWGTEKFSMKVKDILSWLEKQNTERKQLYVRFGDIPSNEKSKIYHGEEEIGDENGVSVYPAFELNGNIVLGLTLPITKTTLYTQQHLLEYDNRPCYLVSGDYVGKGTDGEPLIKNISVIKRLDNYRIKECEKKPVIEMKTPEESLGIDSETYNDIVNTCIFGENKPKFKVGDWIVDNCGYVWKIEGILNQFYILEGIEGGESLPTIEWANKNFHLWTIADANDGDVLAAHECLVLFKEIDGLNIKCYCTYHFMNNQMFHVDTLQNKTAFYPATKEQRDLLFQKMKEAGYEWDDEKKELKKINEQHLISNYFNAEYERGKSDALKSVAWSEDDEKIIKRIDSLLYAINENDFEDIHAWLKSLKNRALPQSKQEWSKEDEKMVNDIIAAIDTLYYHGMVKWLKSLKQRCVWKPSDEQMHAFKEVYDWYNNNFAPSETLTSLYDDLMKLK